MADLAGMLDGFDSDEDDKKPPAKKAPAPKVEEKKKMDESEFEKIDVSQTK